ncbi:hypothetical protein POTOM_024476 [Populus tomentosa]|uniref:Uncharacterized protein n=1 Tax=Populus tomentosa TaxID=118781 RepID=A0A8X8CW90_POPTO|nr:hypothetical protein POTOM_024476 [Populus tomentosa]
MEFGYFSSCRQDSCDNDHEQKEAISSSLSNSNNVDDDGRRDKLGLDYFNLHSLVVSLNKEASVKINSSVDNSCDHDGHGKVSLETSSADIERTELFEKLCLDDFYDPMPLTTFLHRLKGIYENKTTTTLIMDRTITEKGAIHSDDDIGSQDQGVLGNDDELEDDFLETCTILEELAGDLPVCTDGPGLDE